MSFEQMSAANSEKQLPQWKQNVLYWIDRNYGTLEQLQALGLSPRQWYQFNFVEIGLTAGVAYGLYNYGFIF
jgi:hypothetical protein